ncbi:uncharacterized protein M421DRAFT_104431 [Didymella exigua CBS 183.55]|uniref:Uncharacterized protein n=1 Tax=Didymella exigua CBS 183.55 TaxID=1150837 RepID=A0A6A5R747_9PLEO|nr:uncharacterized protein M421DRAFT_104431 [Didymella exigua CBS 183.55]KAF1923443.1 hypothetical protein M421DRAFT_104431 [Didymella exigua CBS 183.55]
MSTAPIITFDYDFSPYGQKIRAALAASNIAFQRSNQPIVLPRPILAKLDITYRRIPLLALGKDIYADTSLILAELQARYGGLRTTPADAAFDVFGTQLFASALRIVPAAALTPEFIKDRLSIFPALADPEYPALRPSGLAEMRARFDVIEREFLAPGPFIAGDSFGLADLHAGWAVGWSLRAIGLAQEPGFSEREFPRIHKWIAQWPTPTYTELGAEAVWDAVQGAAYTARDIGVDEADPLGLGAGTLVTVENSDTEPGRHPQRGRLVGADRREVVVELENGIRLHFPRVGYVVKPAV